ncbi:Vacuolar protein sorting-associated protein 37B [Lamellibrachia satsuma]|nr:Vacuolar protein sorting-associated protein 37B [Lamellibrachia satsuma]
MAQDESAISGVLQYMMTPQLQQLLDNDDQLMALIKDLDQVRTIEAEKDSLLTNNKSIAEYNLTKQPRLTQAKRQLTSCYEQAVTLQKQFEQDKQKLDMLAMQHSLDTILALLQTEAAKTEEESEDIASQFVDGKMTLDSFLETFLPVRKMAHLRRIHSEKMADLLQERDQNPRSSHQQLFSSGSDGFVNSTPPTNLPYPVNAHMPMPETKWY